MAGEVAAPLGEFFVSLIPTQSEVRTCSSCKQYQQLIIFNIIEEFGFDIEVIIQVPPVSAPKSTGASVSSQESQQGQNDTLREQQKVDASAIAFILDI
jgi:hypothetical protein